MPSRNRRKIYCENTFYHAYNRGVEKRKIFLDNLDYNTFLKYLGEYLLPVNANYFIEMINNPGTPLRDKQKAMQSLTRKNYSARIEMLAYSLMPNHFHMQLKQKDEDAMREFLQSLMTRYTGYFNKRHHRVGTLFQECYKAVDIESESQMLYLNRYIHRQALSLGQSIFSQPSSYPLYLKQEGFGWIHPEDILGYFPKGRTGYKSYRKFIEATDSDLQNYSASLIKDLILEEY